MIYPVLCSQLLRLFSEYNQPQELLILFYSAIIQSVLCSSITAWFGSAIQDIHSEARYKSVHQIKTIHTKQKLHHLKGSSP